MAEIELKRLGNLFSDKWGTGLPYNVWDKNGLCPTLTTMQGGGREPMIIDEPKLIGGLGEKVSNGGTQYYNQDRVCDSDGVAVAVSTSFQPNYLIVGMRGRNPNNPSDRTPGIELEQRLEPNSEGICNTLTTVQKDNLVLEETIKIKQATKQDYIECKVGGVADFSFPDSKTRRGRVEQNGDISPTLMSGNSEIVKIEKVGQISNEGSQCGTVVSPNGLYPTVSAGCHGYANPHIAENYRIRKLTPRECFRLMNVEEEQFNRAEKVVSNSQLYKVAGNAIVVSVLCALFSQLGIQGKKKWNDMTEPERLQIVHKGTIFEKRENK